MSEQVLVSICCLAYNHEKYIRQALESFVNQKTDFKFEVLVHDDASTDHTADIIREYEEKYPDIIKPIYQTENQFSKNVAITNTIQFPRAKGKYVAFCEGDDYWCDENKLQKQVEFLENNPEYSGSVHNTLIVNQNDVPLDLKLYQSPTEDITTIDGYLNFPHTSSFVFKNPLMDKTAEGRRLASLIIDRDRSYALYMLKTGKVRCFNETMSHYRLVTNHGDSYSARKSQKNITEERLKVELGLYKQIAGYGLDIDFYKHYFRNTCAYSLMYFLRHPSKKNFMLHCKALRAFPYPAPKFFKAMFSYVFDKIKAKLGKA